MNQVQSPTVTDVHDSVESGVIDGGAVQIARDLISGKTGDYLFYPVSDHAYALILSDFTFIQGSTVGLEDMYFASDFDWYLIEITRETSTVTITESGSQYGNFWGVNNAGAYDGSHSGTFSLPQYEYSYAVYYYHDEDGVQIQNPHCYAVWGSKSTLPKLQEGSAFYAYASTCILGVAFCFALFVSIFKHVS